MSGQDPIEVDSKGNQLLWSYYQDIKDVDAVPVSAGWWIALFISGNFYPDPNTASILEGHGVWRCAAIPTMYGATEGIDFVVFPYDQDTDPVAHRDMAIHDEAVLRLDPDPVELPTGDWWVGIGTHSGALQVVYGAAATVGASWKDAWT